MKANISFEFDTTNGLIPIDVMEIMVKIINLITASLKTKNITIQMEFPN